MNFSDLEEEYRKWLHLDDLDYLRVVYASIIANTYNGLPLWLIIIGKAGSGKTEVIDSLSDLDLVYPVSTLTPIALASAYNENESLLFRLSNRILTVKDFSAITSLNSESKVMLFSFLRDAYDGSFTRMTGKGEIKWTGKFGFIGVSTDEIEREQGLMSRLGERFLYFRLDSPESDALLDKVISGVVKKGDKSKALRGTASRFFAEYKPSGSNVLSKQILDLVKECAKVVVRCRSGVVRDSYTKEITYPMDISEMPTRIIQQLILLCLGLKEISTDNDSIKRVVSRVTVDCIPKTRLRILKALADGHNTSTNDIAKFVKVSQPMVMRTIQELEGLDLVENTGKQYLIKFSALRNML